MDWVFALKWVKTKKCYRKNALFIPSLLSRQKYYDPVRFHSTIFAFETSKNDLCKRQKFISKNSKENVKPIESLISTPD